MPHLVDDERLAESAVVANSTMNRDRALLGRDGYHRALGLDLLALLREHRSARWLDLCCGTGSALLQAATLLGDQVEITGVDLVDFYAGPPPPTIRFITTPLHSWHPDGTFDLITCVHGLHYLGDKLGILAAAVSWLRPDGLLVANFDATSIRIPGGEPAGRRLTAALRAAGFTYDARTHRIHRHGPAEVRFPYRYLGADTGAGPNYTGQPAVHSYYEPS